MMNTIKISQIANDITRLKHRKTQIAEEIKELSSDAHEEAEETLVFEREMSRGCNPSVSFHTLKETLSYFKWLLANPLYEEGDLLVKREYILIDDVEYMDDVRIDIRIASEPVAWEDYNDDVRYLQVFCEVKKQGESLEKEVVALSVSLAELSEKIVDKGFELRELVGDITDEAN